MGVETNCSQDLKPVNIEYDLIIDGKQEKKNLPFVIGVIADYKGHLGEDDEYEYFFESKDFDLCHQKNTLKFIDINIIEIYNIFSHNPRVFGIIFAL